MITTANDIFNMPAQEQECITTLLRHLPISFDYDNFRHLEDENTYSVYDEKIKVEEVMYHNFDGRRIWKLTRVSFDGEPVMIMQNAGREGDDHDRVFIVDQKAFADLVKRMLEIARFDTEAVGDDFVLIGKDEERDDLDDFYGGDLARVKQWNQQQEIERTLAHDLVEAEPELSGHWVITTPEGEILRVGRNKWSLDEHVRDHGAPDGAMVLRLPGMLAPEAEALS